MSMPWSNDKAPHLPVPTDAPGCALRAASDEDPRLGHLIGVGLQQGEWPQTAILGFPCDEGVRRNGGNTGAREAPDRIRQALYRFTPAHDPRFTPLLARMYDFGNLRVDSDLERAQEQLGEAVAACLSHGTLPIVLGGGHETAFGHFLGYVATARRVSILNWDAHADVRPLLDGRGHSGSPFRQALEHPSGLCRSYTVAGLLPHATARSHLNYLEARESRFVWRHDLTVERVAGLYSTPPVERRRDVERLGPGIIRESGDASREPDLLVSFDIDAVDQAFAPGVSAPAVGGLTPELWLEAARRAGRSSRVRSLDIVETNPQLDRDDQTSRLAALTIWTFLAGFVERV